MKWENVHVGYGSHVLFQNLTIELPCGELTCLMGPNGCGKSSLMRVMSGLQSSNIAIKPRAKSMAVVLTENTKPPHLTVWEAVALGRYPYLDWSIRFSEEDKKIISESISKTGIENLKDKELARLSDGQFQLVMIARALAQQTPYLLLDEPTSHLDLNHRVEVMTLLRRVAGEGKGILMATHELDLALQMADKIWLADEKKIVTGIPEDLVLSGLFDKVFQWKGYDLKTGKVRHRKGGRKVHLKGTGAELLWTKNALERNGCEAGEEGVTIHIENNPPRWTVGGKMFASLEELIKEINK